MNYDELTDKHQEEFNNFPIFFAFNDKQFEEGLKKFGAKENDLYRIPGNGFILKKDSKKLSELLDRHGEEMQNHINNDKDGAGFIKGMFYYELSNYEYCYSRDLNEILEVLNLTMEEVKNNKALSNGLKLALEDYQPVMENC